MVKLWQRVARYFAVGIQWQFFEFHDESWHHVFGQTLPQKCPNLLHSFRGRLSLSVCSIGAIGTQESNAWIGISQICRSVSGNNASTAETMQQNAVCSPSAQQRPDV